MSKTKNFMEECINALTLLEENSKLLILAKDTIEQVDAILLSAEFRTREDTEVKLNIILRDYHRAYNEMRGCKKPSVPF